MFATKVILVFLFMTSVHSLNFNELDKQTHIATTYAISTTSFLLLRKVGYSNKESMIYSFIFTNILGLAREYFGNKDKEDIKANLLGSTLGVTIPLLIKRW